MKDKDRIDPAWGFSGLEGKLINALCENPPDFETADDLISLGADVNTESSDPEQNMLSEIIWDRGGCAYYLLDCNKTDGCEDEGCIYCDQGEAAWRRAILKSNQATVEVIKYMLERGFDVNHKEGLYGAQCLHELTLPMSSKGLLEATRILFDAGAQNKCIDPKDVESTALEWLETEASYNFMKTPFMINSDFLFHCLS